MASACSSTTSLQKSCVSHAHTNVSVAGSRTKSETSCSKRASCFLQRKKPANPLSVSIRPPKVDAVRQRVRSARMLKIRSLQSQLNDANYHLMELAQENRALKSTQRRQDKALNSYEGVNADLPRLIHSHGEENRTLQERNRTLKRQLREVTDTLKVRDEELLVVKDQLKQLTNLAKDKQLEERAQLRQNLNEAKDLIKSYESEISILNRKLELEVKNCRHKLNSEALKYKKCQEQLAQALGQVKKGSQTRLLSRRFDNSPSVTERKSTSNLTASTSKETLDSDVKLEPIKKRNSSESRSSLTSPVDKIKARLSTPETRPQKIEDFNEILEKLSLEEEHLKKSLQSGIKSTKVKPTKLETLVQKRNAFQKPEKESRIPKAEPPPRPPPPAQLINQDKNLFILTNDQFGSESNEEESPRLETEIQTNQNGNNTTKNSDNDQCSDDEDNEDVLQHHVKNLKESEMEFNRMKQEIDEIEKLEQQIDKNKHTILLKREDNELVEQLWNEEYSFRLARRERLNGNGDVSSRTNHKEVTNGLGDDVNQNKDPIVALENKRKLLAALREIDNGNSVERGDSANQNVSNNHEIDNRKSRLMKELFG